VKPGDEGAIGGESRGFSVKQDEDGLGGVFGEVGVVEATSGEAIDPAEMSADEVGEGGGAAVAVLGEEFDVGH